MLVDLARNDLGRVCVPGSVRPDRADARRAVLEGDAHRVDRRGRPREDIHPFDALAVTFPAGTVTGAPKRRAMELIAEHEPTARGPYAGAVGYLTFAGDLDFCITIRTAVVADGRATSRRARASSPTPTRRRNCVETKAKASALLPAMRARRAEATR